MLAALLTNKSLKFDSIVSISASSSLHQPNFENLRLSFFGGNWLFSWEDATGYFVTAFAYLCDQSVYWADL